MKAFPALRCTVRQFAALMEAVQAGRVDMLVCYRLDRVSRSVTDFAALIETLNRRQVSFVCIREQFDTATPMGKAMLYIASVFAQLERETIAERVSDNMQLLARTANGWVESRRWAFAAWRPLFKRRPASKPYTGCGQFQTRRRPSRKRLPPLQKRAAPRPRKRHWRKGA